MGRSATVGTAGIWHRPFLAAFSNSGNIGASARRTGIHRQTVYKALDQFDDHDAVVCPVVSELYELAIVGGEHHPFKVIGIGGVFTRSVGLEVEGERAHPGVSCLPGPVALEERRVGDELGDGPAKGALQVGHLG